MVLEDLVEVPPRAQRIERNNVVVPRGVEVEGKVPYCGCFGIGVFTESLL